MKTLLGVLCFVLISQGIGGLAYEFTDGWFRIWALVHRIPFLDGYETYASVALLTLGVAVGAATESLGKAAASPGKKERTE
ncbi:hypothetical protein ACH429_01735 [Streptomyces pathocidini]|uniref:Uncharacterized protein n=1 Tax=Streptomyces pathocidini TaxID=1650571 RepID=A0ABW7UPX1_9ACTN|nr:hypothetical protein [Streptomyces pathocidini]